MVSSWSSRTSTSVRSGLLVSKAFNSGAFRGLGVGPCMGSVWPWSGDPPRMDEDELICIIVRS